ncbi:uncharacterized protein SCHCODRAFT_02492590 [Schizophyllum commune H4-8]|nr:uncharacterized protein SCHCODRAFT_02492590 [Schizophyllum commune H4-8]KAI5897187.1 hypothetical protein SCHCODRAFT_02492590 [Schizophyllum commune H4-8]
MESDTMSITTPLYTLNPPPVYRLPTEILAGIFVLLKDYHYTPASFARTVSRVCKPWRSIAHSTGQLWNAIVIDDDEDGCHLMAYLDACLTLSGLCGLDVTCYSKVYLPSVIAKLLPHAHRWEYVELTGHWRDFLSLSTLSPSCPRLKKVSFESDPREDLVHITGMLDFTRDSTAQLEHLSVDASCARRVGGDINIPSFIGLRHLDISLGDTWHCPSALLRAASLSRLTIDFLATDCCRPDGLWTELDALEPVHMPVLYKLCLCNASHVLMRYIVAPALEELLLTCPTSARGLPDGDFCTSLLALVSASDAPHPLLDFTAQDIPEDFDEAAARAFPRALERLGNLEELSVQCTGGDDRPVLSRTVISALVCREGVPPLVPNLTKFCISPNYGCFPPEVMIEHLLLIQDVLFSRAVPRVIDGTPVAALESAQAPEIQYMGPVDGRENMDEV